MAKARRGERRDVRARRGRGRARRGRLVALLGLAGLLGVVAVVVVAALFDGSRQAGPVTWSVAAYQGGPRLAVDRALVDHGAVPYGHEVRARFRLKNVGDRPLALQPPRVAALEGC